MQKASRKVFNTFDLFAAPINFRANKHETIGTWLGTIFSILTISVVFIYGFKKFNVLKEYGDTKYQNIELVEEDVPTFQGGIPENVPLGMFLVGLNNYAQISGLDSNLAILKHLSIKVVYKDAIFNKSIIELKTSKCTNEHLDYFENEKIAESDNTKMMKKLRMFIRNPDVVAYCLEDPTIIKLGMDDEYTSR